MPAFVVLDFDFVVLYLVFVAFDFAFVVLALDFELVFDLEPFFFFFVVLSFSADDLSELDFLPAFVLSSRLSGFVLLGFAVLGFVMLGFVVPEFVFSDFVLYSAVVSGGAI